MAETKKLSVKKAIEKLRASQEVFIWGRLSCARHRIDRVRVIQLGGHFPSQIQ